MKGRFLLFFVLLFFGKVSLFSQSDSYEGFWLGTLHLPENQIRIVLHFEDTEVGIYSIDQREGLLETTTYRIETDSIWLVYPKTKAKLNLCFNPSNTTLHGEFVQNGKRLNIVFQKQDSLPKLNRPQTPRAPFPYEEEAVWIKDKKHKFTLAGTLSVAPHVGKGKVILLVSGSGPTDRDESVRGHKPFAVIADYFARNGFSVLRYDKRGIGQSTGLYISATTFDFLEDAQLAYRFLEKDRRFDKDSIFVLGHSEGGLIASMMAADPNTPLAAAVLLASPAQKGDDLIFDQSKKQIELAGYDSADVEGYSQQQRFLLDLILKYGNDATEEVDFEMMRMRQEIGELQWQNYKWEQLKPKQKLITTLVPWFITFLQIDPQPYLEKVKCPLLVFFAEKDVQVLPSSNVSLMKNCLSKLSFPTKIVVVPGKNHLFQTAKTGNVDEYGIIEETFSIEVLQQIKQWVNQLNRQ